MTNFVYYPEHTAPIVSVCAACKNLDGCALGQTFPVMGCKDWADGYEGPTYPDGDAYREIEMVVIYGNQRARTTIA